jgi:hypothetical protein
MLRTKTLRSLGLYIVNKDNEVFWLDLAMSGLRYAKNQHGYKSYFTLIKEWLFEYGLVEKNDFLEDCVLVYSPGKRGNGTVILMIYSVRRGKVHKVVLAPLKLGVLKTLDSLLEKAGWKRIFLLDIRPIKRLSPTM